MHAILLDDSTNEEGQEFLLEEFHSPDTSVGNRESLARCKGVLLAAGSIMQRIVGQSLQVQPGKETIPELGSRSLIFSRQIISQIRRRRTVRSKS